MKGYKGTRKDMTCKGLQYELGKTYEMPAEDIVMCENGFHFCKYLANVKKHYSFTEESYRFFEVEIPDDACVIEDGNKSVTNKIKFVRELTEEDFANIGVFREYNPNGRLVKYSDGQNEFIHEFDGDKLIYAKINYSGSGIDIERFFEYDENGYVKRINHVNGEDIHYKKDSHGNILHYKNSEGYEYWKEYDANGNCTHFKDSSSVEYWNEYDAHGNEIYSSSRGYEIWKKYDANNNLIHYKNSDGCEIHYDSHGNVIA